MVQAYIGNTPIASVSAGGTAMAPPGYSPASGNYMLPFGGMTPDMVNASNLASMREMRSRQLIQERINYLQNYLGAGPQIQGTDPGTLKGIEDRYYAESVAPRIAELQTQQASSGQNNSSFGGGQLAAMEAAGRREAANYAASYGSDQYRNSIDARNSYLQGANMLAGLANTGINAGVSSSNTDAEMMRFMMESGNQSRAQERQLSQARQGMYFTGGLGLINMAAPYLSSGMNKLMTPRPVRTPLGPVSSDFTIPGGGTIQGSQPFGYNSPFL